MFGGVYPSLSSAYYLVFSVSWAYSLSTTWEMSFSWIYSELVVFCNSFCFSFSGMCSLSLLSIKNEVTGSKHHLLLEMKNSLLIHSSHLLYYNYCSKLQECCIQCIFRPRVGRMGTGAKLQRQCPVSLHFRWWWRQKRFLHLFACRAS